MSQNFEIDVENKHMIGWLESHDAFTSKWQIPVVWQSKQKIPLFFYQICDSIQLYNILCDMNVL